MYDMDSILRSAGADRVSECASDKLAELLEDAAGQLVFEAKLLARHAGRSEISARDIYLAADFIKARA